jgi:hypothetical protein
LRADGTAVAWGAGTANTGSNPEYGQSQVPASLSNVVAIAGGAYHSLALQADGTVLAWGAGTSNTGTNPQYGQSQVPTGLSNVIALAGRGSYHTLVLEGDGRPRITVQPASQAAAVGADANFIAMAVGAQPLSYQWQYDGTNIPGATNATLLVSSAQPANMGYYQMTVSNSFGWAVSQAASLVVAGVPPVLTVQPTNQLVLAGSTVVFSSAALGAGPLSYQWQKDGTNLVDGGKFSGAATPVLIVSNVQPAEAGNYSVLVSNLYGPVLSANASLTVGVPATITTQPVGQNAIAGSVVNFRVTAIGTGTLGYQWRKDGTNLAD